eukprot:scaffold435_cov342-Pavlova_lutheri.AAC.44
MQDDFLYTKAGTPAAGSPGQLFEPPSACFASDRPLTVRYTHHNVVFAMQGSCHSTSSLLGRTIATVVRFLGVFPVPVFLLLGLVARLQHPCIQSTTFSISSAALDVHVRRATPPSMRPNPHSKTRRFRPGMGPFLSRRKGGMHGSTKGGHWKAAWKEGRAWVCRWKVALGHGGKGDPSKSTPAVCKGMEDPTIREQRSSGKMGTVGCDAGEAG